MKRKPREAGQASIIIALVDGDLVVTHGTAGVELGRAKYVPHGTWRRVWEVLEGQFNVKRSAIK